jgi:hypothetical protein
LGCPRYDPHDPLLVLFFQRRDHDARHYLRPLLLHAVDALLRLVQPDDDGSREHYPEHSDLLHDEDVGQSARDE